MCVCACECLCVCVSVCVCVCVCVCVVCVWEREREREREREIVNYTLPVQLVLNVTSQHHECLEQNIASVNFTILSWQKTQYYYARWVWLIVTWVWLTVSTWNPDFALVSINLTPCSSASCREEKLIVMMAVSAPQNPILHSSTSFPLSVLTTRDSARSHLFPRIICPHLMRRSVRERERERERNRERERGHLTPHCLQFYTITHTRERERERENLHITLATNLLNVADPISYVVEAFLTSDIIHQHYTLSSNRHTHTHTHTKSSHGEDKIC